MDEKEHPADSRIPSAASGSDTNTEHIPENAPTPKFELSGLPLALVITGLALAIFLMSLDSSIIATAIPEITARFNSTEDIGWYGSAYSFALCALQPIAGKLFANFSMKGLFLLCLAVFELGSLLCAAAVNSPMLIVGRAIAGAGAAGCFTGAFCIVAASLPLERRPFYVGILQATFGIATIIGPILGGAFTQHASWRWCFWINLPIGAVTIFALVFFFKPPAGPPGDKPSILTRLASIDWIGAFLFIPSIIMILLALQWGGTAHPWRSATVIGLFIGGAGLGLVFSLWQIRRGDEAMIPPRLIKERTMFFSCSAEFFAMGAVYISIYYLPQYFQVVKGASPTRSGLMYLPLALSDVLAATLSGASLKYLGYPNPYLLLGTALMAIATGLFSTFTPGTTSDLWISSQVLQGLGVGMTLTMPYVATQTVLAPEDIPVGTSLLQCFQFFGAAVNLAIGESIFRNEVVSQLGNLGFTTEDVMRIFHGGSAEARNAVEDSQVPMVVEAYNWGITRSFYVAAAVAAVAFVLSLGLKWRSIKPPKAKVEADVEAK